jgi:hypothetical protein
VRNKDTDRYLSTAAECVRLAEQMKDPTSRLVLVDLAATWMRLAERAEKDNWMDVAHERAKHAPGRKATGL